MMKFIRVFLQGATVAKNNLSFILSHNSNIFLKILTKHGKKQISQQSQVLIEEGKKW